VGPRCSLLVVPDLQGLRMIAILLLGAIVWAISTVVETRANLARRRLYLSMQEAAERMTAADFQTYMASIAAASRSSEVEF